MSLIETYKDILRSFRIRVDDNGYLINMDDTPAILNDMPIALPLPNILKKPVTERIIFHPLLEEINKGESDIMRHIRRVANIRINFIFGTLGLNILKIAISPELHSKMHGDQLDMLLLLKDSDAKTLSSFGNIMLKALKSNAEKAFINIYLKRGGVTRNTKYARVGIVTFPLLEQLEKNEDPYGVKIRKADRTMYINLYKVIFPDIKLDAYNIGSDTYVAPHLDALLRTNKAITDVYNELVDVYKDHIDNPDILYTTNDWVDAFNNLELFTPEIIKIPMQNGNKGSITPETPPATMVSSNTSTPSKDHTKPAATMADFRSQMRNPPPSPGFSPIPIQQQQVSNSSLVRGTAFNKQSNYQQSNNNPWQNGYQPNNNPWQNKPEEPILI